MYICIYPHKNGEIAVVENEMSGTILYFLVCLNSRLVSSRLKYVYSGTSGNTDLLPTNN